MIWLKTRRFSTTTARRINELKIIDKDDVERTSARSLRGNDYEHTLSDRMVYELRVGADELADPDCRAFMRDFWTGHERSISLSTSETEPDADDFIPVTLPSGLDPITFFEDHLGLPAVVYTLTEKARRTT